MMILETSWNIWNVRALMEYEWSQRIKVAWNSMVSSSVNQSKVWEQLRRLKMPKWIQVIFSNFYSLKINLTNFKNISTSSIYIYKKKIIKDWWKIRKMLKELRSIRRKMAPPCRLVPFFIMVLPIWVEDVHLTT